MKYRFEIDSANCEHKEGTSNKTGKDYSFYLQKGYVFMKADDRYPEAIELSHDKLADALQPGVYVMDLSKAIYLDRFKNFALDMRNAVFTLQEPAVKKPA